MSPRHIENILNELPLGVDRIKDCIPHRYPFLLIDKVYEIDPGKYIRGVKNVSYSDPVFQGHFPGRPTYPGVLQVECLAQLSAVLAIIAQPDRGETVLTEITSTRYRNPVRPGDVMNLEVKVMKARQGFYWFEGIVKTELGVTCEARFSAKLS